MRISSKAERKLRIATDALYALAAFDYAGEPLNVAATAIEELRK